MPAYNAAATLKRTYDEVVAQKIVDLVIVVDDASSDETTKIAGTLPNTIVHTHPKNKGYGANQKTCYRLALEQGGDIIIMVHPDYQYTPKLIPAIRHYVRAIKIRPDFADAYYNLGGALYSKGDINGAASCFNQALKIRPDYKDAQKYLAFISKKK